MSTKKFKMHSSVRNNRNCGISIVL